MTFYTEYKHVNKITVQTVFNKKGGEDDSSYALLFDP